MQQEPTQYTPQDALDLFLLDCKARRLTSGTLQFYKGKLTPFISFCGAISIDNLTQKHIRQYLASIVDRGLTSQYQHNIARAIRALLNFCVRDGLIAVSPFDKVKMPRLAKKVLPSLSEQEIKTILAHCNTDRDKAIFLLLLDTGLRASELCSLNWQDIDLQSGVLTVQDGKGQKGRMAYLGIKTRKQLTRYHIQARKPDGNMPVFASTRIGERLTGSGMVQIMKRLRNKSGVKTLTAHAIRRTFAINCLRNGMNIYHLQKLMGHADIAMLRRYLSLTESDLQQAHEKFGTVDNL